MTDLERLMHVLVEVLTERGSASLHQPISVGELRTNLLPYRLYRSRLRLGSAEDYDHLLLRLVAEEDGWVRTLPADAAVRSQAELASPNPELTLLEELNDATVQIGAASLTRALALETSAPDPLAGLPLMAAASDPSETGEAALPAPNVAVDAVAGPLAELPEPAPAIRTHVEIPVLPPPHTSPPPPEEEVSEAPAMIEAKPPGVEEHRCPGCAGRLPTGRHAIFCPHCGVRVEPFSCRRCGAELEPEWRFCIGCGTAVPAGMGRSSGRD